MGNLRDIRRRIKSIKNTSQITKAMQMVASAKMRRAQDQAIKGRAYIAALAQVLYHLKEEIAERNSPLLTHNSSTKELVLVINTDRGLCGGLNTNLFKAIRTQTSPDAHFITIGRKLNSTLAKVGSIIDASWSLADPLALVELRPIFDFCRQKYQLAEYGKITVAYSSFVNTMVQKPIVRQLLPISEEELLEVAAEGNEEIDNARKSNFIMEPNSHNLLDTILPLYFFYILAQVVLEARASEHSSRMVSMKAASENAQTIIGELTLEYNKARQTQITNELLEITTAMRAME
ncbi:MAG: ATP synthase F1 subunit gamma [Akkermansia sp.]